MQNKFTNNPKPAPTAKTNFLDGTEIVPSRKLDFLISKTLTNFTWLEQILKKNGISLKQYAPFRKKKTTTHNL
ncbi:MAG: hypothetical protein K0Q79_1741 [Flavipsychrobacter sp.]|nr:hypothetical protein [Flavipsychrobacter sp.]